MKAKSILTALLASLAICANAQEGSWSGELDVQGSKLPLVFNFNADGCTMDSPLQGAKGIKAEKSYTPEGKLKITIPQIGASFEGFHVMNIITGTFHQAGLSLPLTLKPGAPKANRPQTPKAPFPYTTEEVAFYDGEIRLNGTLTLPEGYNKQTPVVLMVTGSGQQNRDEELFEHKPFAVIADALARQGIASLRYDDRGYGEQGFPFHNFTTYHFMCDASAGLKLLRNRFDKVGILGHSEGGTIAMMLAAEGKADFIVSLAGMAVSGKETLVGQTRKLLGASGIDSGLLDTYCKAFDKALDMAANDKTIEVQDIPDLPDGLRQNLLMAIKQMMTPYIKHIITVDVRPQLSEIKCPVLALNGTLDTQVDSQTNLSALDAGLTHSQHKVVQMDGLNHLFQHCKTGLVSEYHSIEETISPEVLTIITSWIKELK